MSNLLENQPHSPSVKYTGNTHEIQGSFEAIEAVRIAKEAHQGLEAAGGEALVSEYVKDTQVQGDHLARHGSEVGIESVKQEGDQQTVGDVLVRVDPNVLADAVAEMREGGGLDDEQANELGRELVAAEERMTGAYSLAVPEQIPAEALHDISHVESKAEYTGYEHCDNVEDALRESGVGAMIDAAEDGSALKDKAPLIVSALEKSDDLGRDTREIARLLQDDTSAWRVNSIAAKLIVGQGEVERSTGNMFKEDEYVVDKLPVAMPTGDRNEWNKSDEALMKSIAEMTEEEKVMMGVPRNATEVRFADLDKDMRADMLAMRLFESESKSQNREYMQQADARNRRLFEESGGNPWQAGDFVHGTRSDTLGLQMKSGLLCGEAVGLNGAKDSVPFNVDMSEIPESIATRETPGEISAAMTSSAYGNVKLIMHRDKDSFDTEGVARATDDHRVIFGAVPYTEVSAVYLDERVQIDKKEFSNEMAESVLRTVVENGFYTPVYDSDGTILLTPEQYDAARAAQDFDYKDLIRHTPQYQERENAVNSPKVVEPELPDFSFDGNNSGFGGLF